MKKFIDWQVVFGICLVLLSAGVYAMHYVIFRDAHHIFIYLLGDIAFVFIEVLMVVLILERVLHFREKRSLMNKLNMVIGAFFSETGRDLLLMLSACDPDCSNLKQYLIVSNNWSYKDFRKAKFSLEQYACDVSIKSEKIAKIRDFLISKRYFLLNLLENPNLLEHEAFTNLLWAVFHLTEELTLRDNINQLPEDDKEHLENDIKRVYRLLIAEWLAYMRHLKQDYPYLFSLAVRTNPFDDNADIEVKK